MDMLDPVISFSNSNIWDYYIIPQKSSVAYLSHISISPILNMQKTSIMKLTIYKACASPKEVETPYVFGLAQQIRNAISRSILVAPAKQNLNINH